LRKLDDPEFGYEAIILAYAGIERMGWNHRISQLLDCDTMLYAVGQGALGLECRENDEFILDLLQTLVDKNSKLQCECERSFMRTLEGGCSIPLGVSTTINNFNFKFIGSVTSLDGTTQLKHYAETTLNGDDEDYKRAQELGIAVALELSKLGADKILNQIRNTK
jgi:hydroxymethylbilane synthase